MSASGSIWVEAAGHGPATVLFEAGNGADASVWEKLIPQVQALGLRTVRYDREGYGHNQPRKTETYRVEDDLAVAGSVIAACAPTGPVIEVAHSYGGGLAVLGAARDRRIKALVLVDAIVPGAEDQADVARTLAELRPQYAEVREQAPQLARAIIPVVEAFPVTMPRVNAVRLPRSLPVIDIVANGGSDSDPARTQKWRAAHRAFVARNPRNRTLIDAGKSGHQVMVDRPDLILNAIRTAVALVAPQNGRTR